MNHTAQRLLAILVISSGLIAVAAYASAIIFASSRREAADQWGAIAGFGLFGAVVASFWLLATFKGSVEPERAVRVPPAWSSLLVFATVVGIGFGLQIVDRGSYTAPLLAVIGFVAVGAFFLRLAVRWMPDRRLPLRNVVLPGAWGFFVSPFILIIAQGIAVLLVVIAVLAGILIENPDFELDPDLGQRIEEYIDESAGEATTTEFPGIIDSPTVALALFTVVAVIAPISEELVKAFGAILVLSRRPHVSRSDAFLAAVASSLGFAVFEGVGYTLAAASTWQQLILIRAPVVIMHVAATTIIVVGWFRMKETGRGFIPYFIAGAALHAGWNGLYVGFIYSLVGLDSGSDPSAGQAVSILSIVLLLGALFLAGLAWFLSASRKSGYSVPRPSLRQETVERAAPSYAAILRHG